MYYKNPPGRILRKQWSAEWKVFPNIENWINHFKESKDGNLTNNLFYDVDYQLIGDINERTKYMFPNDNSLILGTKFTLAGRNNYR